MSELLKERLLVALALLLCTVTVLLAVWETPDFSGRLFYKNKTFRFLAVRLASAIATSVRISGQRRGL